jgi:hypothetical protein
MLDTINAKYHAYLQAAVPQEQWAAFAAITDEEKDHWYTQWLATQPAPQEEPEPAHANPLSGTELLLGANNEITVPDKDNQFKELGLIRSIQDLERIAVHVADSKIGPKEYHGKPAAAFTTLLYGYEMRINPMVAIHAMHVMEGRLVSSIHLIRSLLERAGVEIETVARWEPIYDAQGAIIDYMSLTKMRRKSGLTGKIIESSYQLTYTQADAAGWVRQKGPWGKMPFIMLPTRNTVIHGREFFGSALNGMYELSELNGNVEYDEDLNMKL